jgi:hypothetical protein
MIDDSNQSRDLNDQSECNLPPPCFDERAAANAQAVQPIPAGEFSAYRNHISSLGRALTSGSRALVLVVIAGLVTGTLGGMTWVKDDQASEGSPTRNESVSELSPANDQIEPRAEVFGVTELRNMTNRSTQIRKDRSRMKMSRAPSAYRVAILR